MGMPIGFVVALVVLYSFSPGDAARESFLFAGKTGGETTKAKFGGGQVKRTTASETTESGSCLHCFDWKLETGNGNFVISEQVSLKKFLEI